ncbi:unnamed protein product [Trifolium pratense]|uniref:Uncharacterized protein n=1 Tax=Trifolium pratense TaxID=57577 RepID=A0ACB0JLK3_TRIPR|nr:unnamed protein product [Trifolium pratense]
MQKVPNEINEGQKKLQLFTFSLTGTAKEWLQCLPSGTIQTWKELEDKFLERFFTHNQFQKRKADIMNIKQHDNETLGEAYERFNLLKIKCPIHSLDTMELMQIFTGGMRIQHMMHLDASVGGSINAKTAAEVKELIEQMCQSEYNMSNEITSKPAGMLQQDKETAYHKEIDLLKKNWKRPP